MKKHYLIPLIAILLTLLLTACGSSSGTTTSSPGETQDNKEAQGTEQAAEQTTGQVTEQTTGQAVNPYAWLGLQDMPECNYLNILASNHYVRVTEEYIAGLSYVSEKTNAADGINTYEEDDSSITVTVNGKTTALNKNSKTYMENDMGDLVEYAEKNLADAMENGTDTTGRSFSTTGSGTIPVYSKQTGDKAKYDYYEYHYPDMETSGDTYTERFYMKDGDVFAIYNYYDWGDTKTKSTTVIKSISGDIPDGMFDIDLSGYKKAE